jgi:hypothetical protein
MNRGPSWVWVGGGERLTLGIGTSANDGHCRMKGGPSAGSWECQREASVAPLCCP